MSNSNSNILSLADQFGFRSGDKKEEAIIDNSRTEEELGSLLVKISNLQEEIGKLKLRQKLAGNRLQYGLVCKQGELTQLCNQLSILSTNLEDISSNCLSIENKLSNPVLGNSLPLCATAQGPLIESTGQLAYIVTNLDSLLGAVEWMSNQDWTSFTDQLCDVSRQLEVSTTRLRSATYNLQQFRTDATQ